jgi:hypothetical protein
MSRTMQRRLLIALAIFGLACDDTPTSPTDPEPTLVTETFSSIVQNKGATSRSFTTTDTGPISVSLTSLSKDGAAVGLALGLADGADGQCAPTFFVVTTVYSGRQLSTTADPGRYCFVVYDVGELTGQTNFTVTVVHP